MILSHEEVRKRQREQWTAASEGWITRREEVSRPTRPITEHIVELSRPSFGQRVLDLACGVGDPAFTLANHVGPSGAVLGLDIAGAMVEGARSWAYENNVQNVTFETIESELELGVPNESFELCTCRHGLMFMPDPQQVIKALSAATKSGGRVTVSTWGLPQNSPAFTLPGQIIGNYVNFPKPESNGPGLFSLSTPDIHAELFETVGFESIETHTFDCPVLIAENPEAMWIQISTMGGPMVKVISELDPITKEKIREEFLEVLSNQFPQNPVVLTGEALVTTGVKPFI